MHTQGSSSRPDRLSPRIRLARPLTSRIALNPARDMTQDRQTRRGRRLTATVTDLDVAIQRAFLIGVQTPDLSESEEERSLDELALLTDTAGSDPVDRELVKRDRIDPATFIGSGKA